MDSFKRRHKQMCKLILMLHASNGGELKSPYFLDYVIPLHNMKIGMEMELVANGGIFPTNRPKHFGQTH